MKTICPLLITAVVGLGGCAYQRTGPLEHDSRSIPRDGSETLRVDLRMGAGELRVRGGTQDMMRGDFSYNVPSWKPDIRYSSTAGHGDLRIEQPRSGRASLRNAKYEWDLQLNDEIPVDVTAHFGAGEARLDLGSLSLRSVEVDMGVGELKMDLRGHPKRDYDVRVRGGIGEGTIYLPHDIGIYAKATGGIGEIKVHGLRQESGHWVNDAYDTAKVQVHLDVHGGIGQINLIAD